MSRLLLLFCLIATTVFAQDPPASLVRGLKRGIEASNPDSIEYYLCWIGIHHLEDGVRDSAFIYFRNTLATNRQTKNATMKALTLNNIGVLHRQEGGLDSSIFYFERALKEYEIAKDTVMASVLRRNLGSIFLDKGHYEKALGLLLDAAAYLEKTDQYSYLSSSYNLIGLLHAKIDEPLEALKYYRRSLDIDNGRTGAESRIAASYNNIGNIYTQFKNYDSALANFRRSLDIKRKLNNRGSVGMALNNIGEVVMKKGDYDEAEQLFEEALEIRVATDEKDGQIATLNNLAHVHVLQGDLRRAEKELLRSESLCLSVGLLNYLKDIYEIRVMLHSKRNDHRGAFEYTQKLLVVKDSLLNQEKAKSLAEMQTKYESLKKEDRIALLEKEGLLTAVELERRQAWIFGLIVAISLILIIVLLVYYNLRTVRRNKIHIELLLKELHHRVKNNLQILSSLLSLQSQQLTDDQAIRAVKSSESRINAMALIHRKLYTVDQNRTVDIREYITELIQYLVYSYGYHEKNFKLDLDINELNLDVDKAIPLGLILNELISNAFKHAYENQPNPSLMINLVNPDMHELSIRIRDNGRGMPAQDEKIRKTFGMKIVSTLIKEMKGSLDVKNENGTTYDLHIPL